MIHSYHMSKPTESSFTEYVIHAMLSSSDSNLFICYSVLPRDTQDAPLPSVMGQRPAFSLVFITRFLFVFSSEFFSVILSPGYIRAGYPSGFQSSLSAKNRIITPCTANGNKISNEVGYFSLVFFKFRVKNTFSYVNCLVLFTFSFRSLE